MDQHSNIDMGERFYSVRYALKLSQEALGKKLSVTKHAIASIEAGRRRAGVQLLYKFIHYCATQGIEIEPAFLRPDIYG